MTNIRSKLKLFLVICSIFAVLFTLAGCNSGSSNAPTTQASVKKMPDQLTKIKVATPTLNIDYLPWFLASEKGIFKKHNLEVEIQQVDGGVLALRGLQSGDFSFIGTLPESVITGVSEGANVKLIGTLTAQSMYSVFVTPDIQKIEDLKGKAGAVVQIGSGNDVILRYWLKQHGLQPDKDVRIISAGGNPSRVQAMKTGQVAVTLLSPPTDLQAEVLGFKKMGLIRDELKSYNHDTIAANGKVLKDTPEVARAFMAATAEAIQYIKDPANRADVIQIGMKALKTNEKDFIKTLEFAIPSYGEKGKLNMDGVKWAIDTSKETGSLKKDVAVQDVVDDRYYVE